MDITKVANKIVSGIKASLATDKKKDNFKSSTIEIEVWDSTCGGVTTYRVKCGWGAKAFDEIKGLTRSEVRSLADAINKGLNDLKNTKGWGNLVVENERTCETGWGYSSNYISFPTKITYLANPCKEFVSLANYMEKYCGIKVKPSDIYNVGIGGKSGRVYTEDGEKYFLCHRPKACEKFLADLRKNRGTNDKVVARRKQIDDVDPWEMECSIRNQLEFNGERLYFVEVVITSPTGRAKATIDVAA